MPPTGSILHSSTQGTMLQKFSGIKQWASYYIIFPTEFPLLGIRTLPPHPCPP